MPFKRVSFFVILFCALFLFVARLEASITLRVVAVNPSEDSEQSVPIKVYLPLEVKPEDLIDKEDLEVAYDTQQGSYYVFGEYALKPKETLEKVVEIKDIWVIDETQIVSLHKEAKDVLGAFAKSPYADRADVLYKGIEKKLKEIEDIQRIPMTNPSQHISDYRYCLSLLSSVKSDLVTAKTLLAEVGPKSMSGLTWKIILFIIIFLGVLSLGFYIIWQRQAKTEAKDASEEYDSAKEAVTEESQELEKPQEPQKPQEPSEPEEPSTKPT